jgi:predicted LPLAT superfamily acyltransferase
MATISALFVALFSMGVVAGSLGWTVTALYTSALIAQYLLVATAARNYGTRFVLNILTEESQSC